MFMAYDHMIRQHVKAREPEGVSSDKTLLQGTLYCLRTYAFHSEDYPMLAIKKSALVVESNIEKTQHEYSNCRKISYIRH